MFILDECFPDEPKSIAVIQNATYKVGYQTNKNYKVISLLSLNKNRISSSPEIYFFEAYYNERIVHPVKYFVIYEFSLESFELALAELKYSKWWNAYGFYIVENTKTYSCNDAHDYLDMAWKFNLLRLLFLCVNHDSKIYLYTYNPYTNKAPNWITVRSFIGKNKRASTLFRRFLDPNGIFK